MNLAPDPTSRVCPVQSVFHLTYEADAERGLWWPGNADINLRKLLSGALLDDKANAVKHMPTYFHLYSARPETWPGCATGAELTLFWHARHGI